MCACEKLLNSFQEHQNVGRACYSSVITFGFSGVASAHTVSIRMERFAVNSSDSEEARRHGHDYAACYCEENVYRCNSFDYFAHCTYEHIYEQTLQTPVQARAEVNH